MSSAWGKSWGMSWGNSWGKVSRKQRLGALPRRTGRKYLVELDECEYELDEINTEVVLELFESYSITKPYSIRIMDARVPQSVLKAVEAKAKAIIDDVLEEEELMCFLLLLD